MVLRLHPWLSGLVASMLVRWRWMAVEYAREKKHQKEDQFAEQGRNQGGRGEVTRLGGYYVG